MNVRIDAGIAESIKFINWKERKSKILKEKIIIECSIKSYIVKTIN